MKLAIKQWFWNKIEKDYGWNYMLDGMHTVIKETEKAIMLEVEAYTLDGEYDTVKNIWVPKKCTLTEKEYAVEEKQQEERMENGLAYNQKLITFCKENGVKGIRKMMKTTTLLKKIEEAGLVAPAK